MGTDHPAEGGERKPAARNETGNAGSGFNRRNNYNTQNKFIKKDKFMGAHPDLQGFVFEANAIRSTHITNFTNVDTRI